MRQARAEQIALVVDENLRLVNQAPKRRRMHDSVPVTLKLIAQWVRRLGVAPPVGGPGCRNDPRADDYDDRLAAQGFDWVWLLSVWQTGPAAQKISRTNPQWRPEFAETLPDLKEEDIAGSGFAIQDYTVHRDLGGAARTPSP